MDTQPATTNKQTKQILSVWVENLSWVCGCNIVDRRLWSDGVYWVSWNWWVLRTLLALISQYVSWVINVICSCRIFRRLRWKMTILILELTSSDELMSNNSWFTCKPMYLTWSEELLLQRRWSIDGGSTEICDVVGIWLNVLQFECGWGN